MAKSKMIREISGVQVRSGVGGGACSGRPANIFPEQYANP